jgi:preprotein translocase subunit SecD
MMALAFLFLLQDSTWEAVFKAEGEDPKKIEETVTVTKKRLKRLGLNSAEVDVLEGRRIQVRARRISKDTWEQCKKLLLRQGTLELQEVADEATTRRLSRSGWKDEKSGGYRVLDNPDKRDQSPSLRYEKLVVRETPVVTESDLVDAVAEQATWGGGQSWVVNFRLSEAGSKRFFEATSRLANPPAGAEKGCIAIVIDGKVCSVPVVQSAIRDAGVITGNFSKNEARELAMTLISGRLPCTLTLEKEEEKKE